MDWGFADQSLLLALHNASGFWHTSYVVCSGYLQKIEGFAYAAKRAWMTYSRLEGSSMQSGKFDHLSPKQLYSF